MGNFKWIVQNNKGYKRPMKAREVIEGLRSWSTKMAKKAINISP